MTARRKSSYENPKQLTLFDHPASIGPEDTVEDAQRYVAARRREGVECPCCSQWAQEYRRPLYNKMAAWLIWLVREYEAHPRWISVNEGPVFQNRKGGGDYSKLHYWGLIERQPNTDPDKLKSGIWKPRMKGRRFAHGKIRLPKHCFIYNDGVVGWSEETVNIREALGKHFTIQDIWAGEGSSLL